MNCFKLFLLKQNKRLFTGYGNSLFLCFIISLSFIHCIECEDLKKYSAIQVYFGGSKETSLIEKYKCKYIYTQVLNVTRKKGLIEINMGLAKQKGKMKLSEII